MATQGNNGTADAGQQSIGSETDTPIDGIAGGHAGGIEPAGQDVDAGAEGVGPGKRHEDHARQGAPGNAAQDSIALGDQLKGSGYPGGETGTVGTQGPGGAQQGGNVKR